MRALVTGGAGFIGSHLAEKLLREGHEVTVLDDLSTGRLENLSPARRLDVIRPSSATSVPGLPRPGLGRLRLHRVDIADTARIHGFFKGIDWVFHLAARADIVPSIKNPGVYYRSNVDGTFSVLEAARRHGVKRFIYAASSSCYGIPDRTPTRENADIRPQYPYALTKWLGEQTLLHWGQVYGMPVVSLRLFNVFGPRSRTSGTYGAVFGVFMAQKLHGAPFTVVGDGRQTRDFVHVTDVVGAFLRAARSKVRGRVFNVGSGRPQSVNRLAGLLGGPVVRVPKRPGEPDSTHAHIGRARRELGWKPEVSFEAGVRDMLSRIEYWRRAPLWTPGAIARATRDWFKYLS